MTVAFEGSSSCAPLRDAPCTVAVVAAAEAAANGPLTYAWSGCAAGHSSRAVCTIDRPGDVLATVDVRDARGLTARRSATAVGVNHPPGAVLSGIVWESGGSFEVVGSLADPEEGHLCGGSPGGAGFVCPYMQSATASGDCRPQLTTPCTCLAGLDILVQKTAERGTCVLTLDVRDSWGLVGTTTATIDYPRVK